MVADHGNGAIIDEAHHGIDRPFRIGAIADDIAEADDPLRTAGAREIEARTERLPVGVDIGKDGQPHASPSLLTVAAKSASDLTDINAFRWRQHPILMQQNRKCVTPALGRVNSPTCHACQFGSGKCRLSRMDLTAFACSGPF